LQPAAGDSLAMIMAGLAAADFVQAAMQNKILAVL